MKKSISRRPISNYAQLTEVTDSPSFKKRTLKVSILRFIPDESPFPVPMARIFTAATDAAVAAVY
jgi:hypothetical protein